MQRQKNLKTKKLVQKHQKHPQKKKYQLKHLSGEKKKREEDEINSPRG